MEYAIPEQDNVRHLFKPEGNGGQDNCRSLSPWIEYLRGHGMTVFSRKMRTTVPGCTSSGDAAIRCPASQSVSDLSRDITVFQKI